MCNGVYAKLHSLERSYWRADSCYNSAESVVEDEAVPYNSYTRRGKLFVVLRGSQC